MSRTSDQSSYTSYVDARWAALFRLAYLLTADSDEAEDLLQTTLIKVYIKWDRVSTAGSVDAYVRRMLLNEALGDRRLQARRRSRHHLVTPVDVAPADDVPQRLDLWSQLSTLPPRQRAVLVLRYYEDQTEEQIAEALGCSRGTVKSQAHDALRTLRAALAHEKEASS